MISLNRSHCECVSRVFGRPETWWKKLHLIRRSESQMFSIVISKQWNLLWYVAPPIDFKDNMSKMNTITLNSEQWTPKCVKSRNINSLKVRSNWKSTECWTEIIHGINGFPRFRGNVPKCCPIKEQDTGYGRYHSKNDTKTHRIQIVRF